MNLCNSDHDEVCYEGRHCPACQIKDDLVTQIADLDARIEQLKNELEELG